MRRKRLLTKRRSRARFSIGQGNWAKVPLARLSRRARNGFDPAWGLPGLPVQARRERFLPGVGAGGHGAKARTRYGGRARGARSRRRAQLHQYCGPLAEKRVRAQRGCRLALRFWARPRLRSIGGRAQVLPARSAVPRRRGATAGPQQPLLDVVSRPTSRQKSSSELSRLVEEWSARDAGIPPRRTVQQQERRVEVAERLREDLLRAVELDPERFAELGFGKFAHMYYYGGPGSMASVNQAVKWAPENRSKVARALRHLIYGEGAGSSSGSTTC